MADPIDIKTPADMKQGVDAWLVQDDTARGESKTDPWKFGLEDEFRYGGSRSKVIGLPPKRTQRATLEAILASGFLSGGHVETLNTKSGEERLCIAVGVPYTEPTPGGAVTERDPGGRPVHLPGGDDANPDSQAPTRVGNLGGEGAD